MEPVDWQERGEKGKLINNPPPLELVFVIRQKKSQEPVVLCHLMEIRTPLWPKFDKKKGV